MLFRSVEERGGEVSREDGFDRLQVRSRSEDQEEGRRVVGVGRTTDAGASLSLESPRVSRRCPRRRRVERGCIPPRLSEVNCDTAKLCRNDSFPCKCNRSKLGQPVYILPPPPSCRPHPLSVVRCDSVCLTIVTEPPSYHSSSESSTPGNLLPDALLLICGAPDNSSTASSSSRS